MLLEVFMKGRTNAIISKQYSCGGVPSRNTMIFSASAPATKVRNTASPASLLLVGLVFVTLIATGPGLASAPAWVSIQFEPKGLFLSNPGMQQSFLITASDGQGNQVDVSDLCRVTSTDTEVVRVDSKSHRLSAESPGVATIEVSLGHLNQAFTVRVGERASEVAVRFALDVVSILTTKGCNGSDCHGSPAGQNGFKLSLFGYDVAADHEAMVDADGGRRVDLQQPRESLILKKPTFAIPHGGGQVLDEDSEEYGTLLRWLQQGGRANTEGVSLTALELYPEQRILVGNGNGQRLVALGRLSDGTTRDMTRDVRYQVGDPAVVKVSPEGALTTRGPGLTTVSARAMGKVVTSQIGVLDSLAGADYAVPEANNFIDELVYAKLRQMNVRPAELTSDRAFARRVFLDAIGQLPTRQELATFLGDPNRDKRSQLIDRLLARPEYASHWRVKFEDWFRNSQLNSQGRSMGVFKDWIKRWLSQDRPYDEVVRALLTSTGDTMISPAANFWHPATDFMLKKFSLTKMAPTVSRLFLGVRLECAECHNHPLENLTQDDFYGFAAFLSQLQVKHGYGEYRRTWFLENRGEVEHPLTKKPVLPKVLGGQPQKIPEGVDRRQVLADWLLSAENPYFARATVNRVWAVYFGVGIVEPFDDFRSTNRPINQKLLDRLARFFVDSGFRLSALHRLILNSRTYQAASKKEPSTRLERILAARFLPRPLPAEVLLDAISQVTEVFHQFRNHPVGTSATDVYQPDSPDYFLVTFGLTRRDILARRAETATLSKALHLMNGTTIREKVESEDNILSRLMRSDFSDREIVTELFETSYARLPTSQEGAILGDFIMAEKASGRTRRRGLENVLWAILNSNEFQLNY